jgi:hypothetical protein
MHDTLARESRAGASDVLVCRYCSTPLSAKQR